MDEAKDRHYRFEGFHLDTRAREVRRAGGALVPMMFVWRKMDGSSIDRST